MNFNYNNVNFLSMKKINKNLKELREKNNNSFSTYYSFCLKNPNNNMGNISYYFCNDNKEKNETNLLKNKNEKKYKSCSSIFDNNNNNNSIQNKFNNNNNLFIKNFFKKKLSQNKNKILNLLNNKKSTSIILDKNESIKYNNYLFGKIFRNIFRERTKVLNNKYNLLYSENEEQYNTTLKKRKNKYPILNENYSKNRINIIKKKINFMKGISDFSFPKIILNKLSLESKLYNELKKNKSPFNKKRKKFILPYLQKDKEINDINLLQTMKLQKSLTIKKQKFL